MLRSVTGKAMQALLDGSRYWTTSIASRAAPMGRHTWCKDCFNAWSRATRNKNVDPIRRARYNRVTRYGLREPAFQALMLKQQGRCAICQEPLARPHVDHDHATERFAACSAIAATSLSA
jgi:hypothetical protein